MKAVCAYCGSRTGADETYVSAAREFGKAVAERGLTLVYGGGTIGLMGAVAEGALAQDGRVVGVMPRELVDHEVPHPGITRLEFVDSRPERKQRMVQLADALVALPGGYGVIEELFEAITWRQSREHGKACGVLNTNGFFVHLLRHLDHALDEGMLDSAHRGYLVVANDPVTLLDRLQ
jgi:uncharacterized protein (TIGR00730 family)